MINRFKAFSLIELMVVIAIVALLAAVAVPSYKDYTIKTQVVKAVAAQNDLNDKIIEAYMKGTWDCASSTTFTFNGTTYTVNGSYATVPGYTNVLTGAIVDSAYGPFSCGNTWIAMTQAGVANLPASMGTEIVCLLGKNSSNVIQRVCGIFDTSYAWAVPMKYLPSGSNCLLSTNVTPQGTSCTNLY